MPKRPALRSIPRNLIVAVASLLLAGALAAAGLHAWHARHRADATFERRIEALDNLRATGAISDAEYDQRVRELSIAAAGAVPADDAKPAR